MFFICASLIAYGTRSFASRLAGSPALAAAPAANGTLQRALAYGFNMFGQILPPPIFN
jgi:hypothetical protein